VPAPRLRGWAILFLAWLPLAIGYAFAVSFMAENRLDGIAYGLRAAAIGGLLVAAVWWVSGRLRWPDQFSPSFYLKHVAAGILYAGAWWVTTATLTGLRAQVPVLSYLREFATSRFMAWNIFFGVVAYALVAAVSYAIRSGERLRRQQVQAAEADALATRAQLTALRAQLNPHFLFNALHSLSVLVRRDPSLAEDALERLGALLRYSLDQGSQEQVPLRQEWAFVESYLAIEKIRLGGRLRVEFETEERALGVAVPPFCLQPLVENAIRHGLDPRPEGGTLWIRLAVESDELLLQVRDDGVGRRLEEPAPETNGRGTGLGLRALQKRLENWEDAPGRLRIETAPGRGFTVTVTLPLGDDVLLPPKERLQQRS
jgi:signal transduction histidine kinase